MTETCEGPKRLKVSWTKLQARELCNQRGWLQEQKKKAPMQNVRPFFHGTVADRVMRKWLDSDDPRPGEMVTWVEDMVEEQLKEARSTGDGVVRWKHRTDREEMVEWVKVLLGRLEPFLLRDVIPYEYQAEYRFRVPVKIPDLQGNMSVIDLVGGMDILVREDPTPPGVWAAYDLKATENPSYVNKTLGQGIFYSLAHLAQTDTQFRTFAFVQPMVTNNPVAYVDITAADMSVMLQRVIQVAHAIWSDDHTPRKDTEHCGWCPVKHACTKFQPGSTAMGFAPKAKKVGAPRV